MDLSTGITEWAPPGERRTVDVWEVITTDWTVKRPDGSYQAIQGENLIAADKCCTNSGWVMFYEGEKLIATWPSWRVVSVTRVKSKTPGA